MGHLFQGRFKGILLDDEPWAVEVSRYLHLNPVRVQGLGLGKRERIRRRQRVGRQSIHEEVQQRLELLEAYPWSSYRAYAGYVPAPKWLTTEAILARAVRQASDQPRRYRAEVRQRLQRGVDETRLERFRDVAALGSAVFVARVKILAGEGARETERRRRLRKRVSFEEVVATVAAARGEAPDVWLGKHGDPGKWLVLRLARRLCGLTLAELGQRLGGMDYAAVGMGLRRLDHRLAESAPLRRLHDELARKLDVKT